ncbi:hypothetical protein BH09BAC1_BH09BAC1_16710 [soil metagenome]
MDQLIFTVLQTAGLVVAACVVADFVIIRLVRYGKVKRMHRERN